jgi:hydroxypyruvate isomerase
MGRIKQSVCYWCFAGKGVSDETLIKEAAKIGYASIEIPPQECWGMIRDHGMVIATIGGHASLTDGLNKRSNHDRIEQEILKNLDTAKDNGIVALIVFSGNRNGLPDDEGLDITTEGLMRVAKAAEEKDIYLVLELLNSKRDHKDYQCDHTSWGAEVIRRVNSPRVKLLYDIYHMQIMEGDIIQTIKDNIQHIGHFHTAGNPGRNDLDENQELYYPPIMKTIKDTGYDLYVGQEFVPKGEPIEALRKAFELCDV